MVAARRLSVLLLVVTSALRAPPRAPPRAKRPASRRLPRAPPREAGVVDVPGGPPRFDWTAASDAYGRLAKDRYFELAFAQAGVLASCADVATQTLERQPVDVAHVAAMCCVAATWSGAINALWLRQLEDRWPGKAREHVAKKTVFHAVVLASLINSAYLVGVPFLAAVYGDGPVPADALASWDLDEFLTLTKLELGMFVPYNYVAFNFVSPRVRPLTHALVSATFNVAVSAVTLGYFDAWVAKALGH